MPIEPASFRAAGLTDSEVEALMLKFLLARGDATGRDIADQVKLPFVLVDQLLQRDEERASWSVHRGVGADERLSVPAHRPGPRAGTAATRSTAPTSARRRSRLEDYIASVHAQSLTNQHPTAEDLHRAFEGLLLSAQHARPARAGDQLRPGAVPVRPAGQRQEQHRRADHRRLRPRNLDAPRDRRRRRDHPPLRSR